MGNLDVCNHLFFQQIRSKEMSSGLASRLKHPKRHELMRSHSQAQILANKLRQDGLMSIGIAYKLF